VAIFSYKNKNQKMRFTSKVWLEKSRQKHLAASKAHGNTAIKPQCSLHRLR
jgi:hypothetical protein